MLILKNLLGRLQVDNAGMHLLEGHFAAITQLNKVCGSCQTSALQGSKNKVYVLTRPNANCLLAQT